MIYRLVAGALLSGVPLAVQAGSIDASLPAQSIAPYVLPRVTR